MCSPWSRNCQERELSWSPEGVRWVEGGPHVGCGQYFTSAPIHGWGTRVPSATGRDWGQEEKGMTEDEMAGWHH